MKKTLAIALAVLLSVTPSVALAKGATTKIVIEGPDLPSQSKSVTQRSSLILTFGLVPERLPHNPGLMLPLPASSSIGLRDQSHTYPKHFRSIK